MLGSAEGLAGNGDHAGFAQQLSGDVAGRVDPLPPEECGNVGIGVERALRHVALDAGDGAQSAHHAVAQADVLVAHFLQAILRPGEGGNGGLLHDGGRVRGGLALQLGGRGGHGRGCEGVAEAPAGHGVGLGERTDDDQPLLGVGNGTAGEAAPAVVEIDVALVADHPDIALGGHAHDGGENLRVNDRTGGIGRRVENDGAGGGRDGALDHFLRKREAVGFVGGDEHALSTRVADDVLERHPCGRGDDDFVAVLDQDLEGIEERLFTSGGGNDFFALVGGTEVGGVAGGDGIAQLDDAGDGRVLGEIRLDGSDGSVLDVLRGMEVRLAGAEIDQVGAGFAHTVGFVGDGHGGGRFNAVDALGEPGFQLRSCCHNQAFFPLAARARSLRRRAV